MWFKQGSMNLLLSDQSHGEFLRKVVFPEHFWQLNAYEVSSDLWKMLVLVWLVSGGSRSFPGGRTAPSPRFGMLGGSELSSASAVSCCWERSSPSGTELGHFRSGPGAPGRDVVIFAAESLLELLWKRSPCICTGLGGGGFISFPQAEANRSAGCEASAYLSSHRVKTLHFSNPLQAESSHTAPLTIRSPVSVNLDAVAMTGIVLEVSLSGKSSESE